MSTVYHFWSPTCTPCNHIKPGVADLKEEFNSLQWVSVDISNDKEGYAKKYDVKVVPTIVVDTNGKIDRHSGTNMIGYYRILRLTRKQ